ncbi:septum formation initiator family protein [Aquirufa ecclesiirivi]|uniref:Septum formation initiator family protein n=1 Tax=Aquirufa ecclesiirivi TaxID=2715124 RepID=A0ABT4JFQ9_9BACT|nr:septum formation initiator family protein [Aquirufa ecclesiirivi]MCZ2474743.1 septum formation initiator family protein [Aquirufa ecclesiirivi]NHC47776.1 septum formation initiator family protein [Aquirufa ecclesiirivi]
MDRVKELFIGKHRFYVISTCIMLVWMFFLDTNDLRVQYRLWNELRVMKNEKAFYQQKLKELEKERRMVVGNPALLEKYAREKYLMKRPNEDIFVIVDEENKPLEP